MTLAVIAYNQETFIEEAIASTFAQTYSPLEIILSDDASSDATFQIMKEMAASYRGPHRVILNRNEQNRGIGGHVNRVFELAKGEFVLLAAGDDVSLPNRVQVNSEAWESSDRKAMCIYSGYDVMGNDGRPLKETGMEFRYGNQGAVVKEELSVVEFFTPAKPTIFGCAAAYNPRLMEVFGPLPESLVHEDEILGFRTAFLGQFIRIESSLVRYRLHNSNVFGFMEGTATSLEDINRLETRRKRELERNQSVYDAWIQDLKTANRKSLISQALFEEAMDVCDSRRALLQAEMEFYSGSFFRKCRLLIGLRKQGMTRSKVLRLIPRLLPTPALRRLKWWRNCIRTKLGG